MNNIMESDIKSRLESLLFVSGEPMSLEKLCKVTGETEDVLKAAAAQLAEDYKERQGGLRIIVNDNKAQMVTAGENAPTVEKLMKIDIEGDLSRSALETISIVAYRGPLSRAEIEEIRGVNTSFTLRQLAIRGLVEKIDNPSDARSYLYKISFDFLRHLGIEKAEDLPRYSEMRERELVSERIMKNEEGGEAPEKQETGDVSEDGPREEEKQDIGAE
jgi:segregation and condensation protein B